MRLQDCFTGVSLEHIMNTYTTILGLKFNLPATKDNFEAVELSVIKKLKEIKNESLTFEEC